MYFICCINVSLSLQQLLLTQNEWQKEKETLMQQLSNLTERHNADKKQYQNQIYYLKHKNNQNIQKLRDYGVPLRQNKQQNEEVTRQQVARLVKHLECVSKGKEETLMQLLVRVVSDRIELFQKLAMEHKDLIIKWVNNSIYVHERSDVFLEKVLISMHVSTLSMNAYRQNRDRIVYKERETEMKDGKMKDKRRKYSENRETVALSDDIVTTKSELNKKSKEKTNNNNNSIENEENDMKQEGININGWPPVYLLREMIEKWHQKRLKLKYNSLQENNQIVAIYRTFKQAISYTLPIYIKNKRFEGYFNLHESNFQMEDISDEIDTENKPREEKTVLFMCRIDGFPPRGFKCNEMTAISIAPVGFDPAMAKLSNICVVHSVINPKTCLFGQNSSFCLLEYE